MYGTTLECGSECGFRSNYQLVGWLSTCSICLLACIPRVGRAVLGDIKLELVTVWPLALGRERRGNRGSWVCICIKTT